MVLAAGLLLILSAYGAAAQVTLDAVPGGVVEIPLVPLDQPHPATTFGQQRVLVKEFGSQWVGLVGLPLDLVPGRYIIQAWPDDDDKPLVREFTVYPRRTSRPAVVELPDAPPDQAGIEFTWRDTLDTAFPLAAPVPVSARALFGRYRQVSDTRSEHVDFVAFHIGIDMPVTAPGNGRIAATTGETSEKFVWVDHGMGLYTRIGPLTNATRSVNEPVETGQTIGRVVLETADQPRSLYWWVYLNGAAVDPFLVSNLERLPGGNGSDR